MKFKKDNNPIIYSSFILFHKFTANKIPWQTSGLKYFMQSLPG
jgi:hypothetical protein